MPPQPDTREALRLLHTQLAIHTNDRVLQLLGKAARTPREDAEMLHAAHASCYHWMQAGAAVHRQRAEWLISRVYAWLGRGEAALTHAEACGTLTREYPGEMEDYDRAYALECAARAYALKGRRSAAGKLRERALRAGQHIHLSEDRRLFLEDLRTGPWNGVVDSTALPSAFDQACQPHRQGEAASAGAAP